MTDQPAFARLGGLQSFVRFGQALAIRRGRNVQHLGDVGAIGPEHDIEHIGQQIIALAYVREIHPWFAGRLKVTMDGGIEVFVSRRQARVFTNALSL